MYMEYTLQKQNVMHMKCVSFYNVHVFQINSIIHSGDIHSFQHLYYITELLSPEWVNGFH